MKPHEHFDLDSGESTGSLPLLPCQLGPAHYGLPLAHIEDVQGLERLQVNPSAEGPMGWLLGREEIPVYDLAHRLGLPFTSSGERVIVCFRDSERLGLLVDRVDHRSSLSVGAIKSLAAFLEPAGQDIVIGAAIDRDRALVLLDPRALDRDEPNQDSTPDLHSRSFDIRHHGEQREGHLVLFETRLSASFARPVRYGLAVGQVIEWLPMPSIVPLPRARGWVHGLTAWRGQPLIVVDLDRRFGWTDGGEGLEDRLLVVWAAPGQPIGLSTRVNVRLQRLPLDHRVVKVGLDRPDDPCLGLFELENSTLVIPDLSCFAWKTAP